MEDQIEEWYFSRRSYLILDNLLLTTDTFTLCKVTMNICPEDGRRSITNAHHKMAETEERHAGAHFSFEAQPRYQGISNQQVRPSKTSSIPAYLFSYIHNEFIFMSQMDVILQTLSKQHQEHEKKIGRQLLDMEHKIDKRILALTEEVGEIRIASAAQNRLSKVEDELFEVKREFQVCDIVASKLPASSYL